jgi:hypothetical protein
MQGVRKNKNKNKKLSFLIMRRKLYILGVQHSLRGAGLVLQSGRNPVLREK